MTNTWHCLDPNCDASGDTQAGAIKHTDTTKHATSQETRP
jgi:hypothetical protein